MINQSEIVQWPPTVFGTKWMVRSFGWCIANKNIKSETSLSNCFKSCGYKNVYQMKRDNKKETITIFSIDGKTTPPMVVYFLIGVPFGWFSRPKIYF